MKKNELADLIKEVIKNQLNEYDTVGFGSSVNVKVIEDGSLMINDNDTSIRFVNKKQVSNLIKILNKEMLKMF